MCRHYENDKNNTVKSLQLSLDANTYGRGKSKRSDIEAESPWKYRNIFCRGRPQINRLQ